MTINNRGLQGQPALPYTDFRAYAGGDVFVDVTFLDHAGTPQIPTSFTYQLDDLTNVQNMIPLTTVVPSSSQYTIQLPAASMQMTHMWVDSQICQLSVYATMPDTEVEPAGSLVPAVTIIELVAIQTPGMN